MSALRRQQGQVTTLAAVFMLSLLGMAALVVDAGAWFRAHRAAQAAADAAALAGAQALPQDTALARSLALEYANDNGGGLDASDVSFSAGIAPADTITVRVERTAPTFFSRLFGVADFDVAARASARTAVASQAKYAAPIAVDEKHEYLSGGGCPCFGQATTLDLKKTGPGAFRLVNIDGSHGGTGPPILADWIETGYEGWMGLGWYFSDPGAKFNSSHVKNALDARIGDELLFPVYRNVKGNGANFEYDVVAWVTFHLTGYDVQGSSGELYGWFTNIVWEGIQGSSGGPSYAAKSIQLVE